MSRRANSRVVPRAGYWTANREMALDVGDLPAAFPRSGAKWRKVGRRGEQTPNVGPTGLRSGDLLCRARARVRRTVGRYVVGAGLGASALASEARIHARPARPGNATGLRGNGDPGNGTGIEAADETCSPASTDHAVDDKGRVAVPARFRAELAGGALVSKWIDGCLALHPRAAWDVAAPRGRPAAGHRRRCPDLSALHLRDGLRGRARPTGSRGRPGRASRRSRVWKTEAVVVGSRNHLELWAPDRVGGLQRADGRAGGARRAPPGPWDLVADHMRLRDPGGPLPSGRDRWKKGTCP